MNTKTDFVRLIEHNDHEGETWTFWLQLTGNEEELAKFADLMAASEIGTYDGIDKQYELFVEDCEPEFIVDKLVEYAEGGYMKSHNKVAGTMACPDDLWEQGERLYKGGVQDFFTPVMS